MSGQIIWWQSFAYILAVFGVVFFGAAAAGFRENRPKVQIAQGILEGNLKLSRTTRTYSEFLGIPYGKSARFEDSEFADGWNGTRDASKYGEPCIQKNIFSGKIGGVEDCLFLNIFTPKLSSESNLSVMVFIHGGGFQFGSGARFGGKYFMDQDVILVTINYRLGPFGFANTGQGANFGLKDQVLALKWVQKNIRQFGGNPNSVTIFGESVGAFSVHYHILSPLSKGLFHRAISQSGTCNSPQLFSGLDSAREFKKLGVLMDCPTSSPEFLIRCLKRIDATVLLKPLKALSTPPALYTPNDPQFFPTVDKRSKRGAVFLPDTPMKLMRSGKFAKVPWILGLNVLEGVFSPGLGALLNESRQSWDWKDAKALALDEHDCAGLEKIRQFYTKGLTTNSHCFADKIINLFSDRFYVHPTKVAGSFHAKSAPTFLYYFTYKSETSAFAELNPSDENGLKRPAHTDELQFLFDAPTTTQFPEIGPNSKHAAFSNYFVKLWVDFAKNGERALEGSSLTATAEPWIRVDSKNSLGHDLLWFQIDTESKMVPESKIFDSRIKFWRNLTRDD